MMKRIFVTILLLTSVSLPGLAQRMDGCPADWGPFSGVTTPPNEAVDRGLQGSGIPLTRDVLKIALRDPRPEVRSLVAVKLGQSKNKADLTPLFQAWLVEKDACTKFVMDMVLSTFVGALSMDATQHPGGRLYATPFQSCTASEPPLLILTLEQVTGSTIGGPTIRMSARNQTEQTLPFAQAPPLQLFSVAVFDSTGAHAKIARGQEWKFEPPRNLENLTGHGPVWVTLPTHEDVTIWTWRLGDDFDMSTPGTYLVRLGGRITYLDTSVCSNTLEVRVEK